MAPIKISVPTNFIDSMKKFMDVIDKTQVIMNQARRVQVPTIPSRQPPIQIQGFINRLPSLFNRFGSTLQRFIDRMIMLLGPRARTFTSMMAIPNYIFSGVNSLTKLAGSMSAGRFALLFRYGGVPGAVIAVVKWVYDKSMLLMETLQKDRIQAILMGTTVGGLRAFRTAFWMLPNDPLLVRVMSILKGYSVSAQALQIYGTLGVQRNIDTVDGMIQVLIRAQEFLRQFPSQEGQAAREFGIPLSPATLAALRDPRITPQELKRVASRELALRGRLGLTPQEEEDTINFLNAKRILFATAKADFLKSLVSSGLADALTKLSDRLTRWLKSFETSSDKPGSVNKSKKNGDNDVIKNFEKQLADLDKYIQDKAQEFQNQISRLTSRTSPGNLAIAARVRGRAIARGAVRGDVGPSGVRGNVIPAGMRGRSDVRGVDGGYRGTVPQPPSSTTGGRWPNIANIKAAAKDQLMKEGLTVEQAEVGANGLVGQAIAESGLVSQYHDAGKGGRPGYVKSIYGADYSRGQDMIRWMAANNLDPNNTANQSRWMAHEVMSNPRFGRSQQALRRGNQDEVSDALTLNYEAPRAPNLAERRRNARTAAGVGAPAVPSAPAAPSASSAPAAPVRTFIPPDIPAGMGPTVADRLKSEGVTLPSAIDSKIRKGEQLTESDLRSIPKDQLEKTNSLVTGMGRSPLYRDAPASAPAPASAAPATGTKTMLFLHGMKSRYGDKSPAEIEASARKYATANGYKLEVIDVSGDDSKGQLSVARARLQQGGIDAVYGFSQGGYAANHLRQEFPGLKYTITGAPGVDGNIALPGVNHMDLPGALAAPGPAKRGPGQWSDLPVQPGKEGRWNPGPVDPRLREIMSGAKDRFEAAHPGYTVVGSSGLRTTHDPHGRAHALDVHIMDPHGNIINPYGLDTTGLYRELAVHARREMLVRHPELAHAFNWGGFFNASGGPGIADPATGANRSDLEHFDIEGERSNRGPTMERLLQGLDTPSVKDVNIKKEEPPNSIIDTPRMFDPTPISTKPKEEEPKKDDPPQHPEEKHGSLTHPALKEAKLHNRSDAKAEIKWNGSAGSNLSDVQTASPMRRRGAPVHDPWQKQTNLLSPQSMITTPPPELDKHEEEPNNIPVNARAFTRAIGRTETDFSRKQAYAENLNQPGTNKNVARLGKAGADYGYYQMNQEQVDDAVNRLGMSRDMAQHLTGGPYHDSTLEQQTSAVAEYMKRRWPNEYKDLIEKNDYQRMLHATRGTWFGLADPPKGRPKDALAEFRRVRDAARINAAAVMGGPAL
jgi:hypothetical protein